MKRLVYRLAVFSVATFILGLVAVPLAQAQSQTVLTPKLPNLTGIVKDMKSAVVLGKALFWDQQAGADFQACASCHFTAGADTRITNELNPGFNDITFGSNGDTRFGSNRSDTGQVAAGYMPSGNRADSNYRLLPSDFPIFQLQDETDHNSPVITSTNDRVAPSGSFTENYSQVVPIGGNQDLCNPTSASASVFHAGPYPARRVEPRQSPTIINAALNNRQFWDGRANNTFNGLDPFGMRTISANPQARLVVLQNGKPMLGYLQLPDSSLASQSMAPPTSQNEMSCNGRSFADVGRKMINRQPLEIQKVDPRDSVLGAYANPAGRGLGLQYTYGSLIKQAFDPKYWSDTGRYTISTKGQLTNDPKGYTQMETNFSMFWGISIMLYEATLISNQSEFDMLFNAGKIIIGNGPIPGITGCDTTPDVDPLLSKGCKIFHNANFIPPIAQGGITGGNCLFCHNSPGFTESQTPTGQAFTPFLNPVPDINNTLDIRDLGFANIGVKPYTMDLGVGGTDPYGNPLSYGKQYLTNHIVDPYLQNNISLVQPSIGTSVTKLEIAGAVKIPSLRNAALTPPYFMWGGYGTLRQAMKVYNRGGNRRDIGIAGVDNNNSGPAGTSTCSAGDDSGTGAAGDAIFPVTGDCKTNVTGVIVPLGLKDCDANGVVQPNCNVATDDLSALVRYIQALTDPRVQCDQAPFDHPSLLVYAGHTPTDHNNPPLADDLTFELPAVGAGGYSNNSGLCIPNSGDLFAPGMQARSGGH